MFARFDENPAMTLRVIKETKRYGQTDARTDNVKTVYPLQTKFAGGITRIAFCQGDGYLWPHCCMNNLYILHRSLYAPTDSF